MWSAEKRARRAVSVKFTGSRDWADDTEARAAAGNGPEEVKHAGLDRLKISRTSAAVVIQRLPKLHESELSSAKRYRGPIQSWLASNG